MSRDWSELSSERARSPRSISLLALLSLGGAVALFYFGSRLQPTQELLISDPSQQRPLTLGEARFFWRGEPLKARSEAPSVLPPVQDPLIPEARPKLNREPVVAPRLEPPVPPALQQLSLGRSALEAERKEAERKEAERKEAERKEAERKEAERKEAERKEAERKEAERKEAERKEAERKEAERIKEAERKESRAPQARQLNLQVKAFKRRTEAIKFVQSLSEELEELKGLIYIQSASSRGQPIYRVRIGPFSDRPEAEEARALYVKRFGLEDAPFISQR